MDAVTCTYVTNANSRYVRFMGEKKLGRGTSAVKVDVEREVIVALAKIFEHTNHAGHATWHLNNPKSPIPCSSCKSCDTGIPANEMNGNNYNGA